MCFSATGSFAAAGVLGGLGAAVLARPTPRPLRLLAAVPLMFGLQQAAEGVVWRTMDGGASAGVHLAAVEVFLAFALVVWPLWIPGSLLAAETSASRRRAWIMVSLAVGAAAAAYGVAVLLASPSASIAQNSLRYRSCLAAPRVVDNLQGPAYLFATLLPFFVSSVRWAKPLGLFMAVSFAVSWIAWQSTLTSVWCFFAAILSVLIVIGPLDVRPTALLVRAAHAMRGVS